ncbi:MAG: MscL family protein [Candidatus Pacebacteria bacterium]|nr:MscL family protein [Candidatus Paceibacterota bacterium]
MKGFLDFVREQGAIGLAVGFILGGAVSDLVKSLIDNIINPLLGILLNQAQGITQASVVILGATIKYGALINTLINFVVIAAVVYFGVKQLGLDKLDKKK